MTKAELYVQIALAKVSEQYQRGRGFDQRAASLIGIAVTLGGISAIVLNFSETDAVKLSDGALVAVFILVVAMFGTVVCCMEATRPRKGWRHDPNLRVFSSQMGKFNDEQVLEWVSQFTRDAVEVNNRILDTKGRHLVAAGWFLLAMALALVVLGVLVNL